MSFTQEEEAELAALERICAYCKNEVDLNGSVISFGCLHYCHAKCCSGKAIPEKCPDCICTPISSDAPTLTVSWMNDKKTRKQVEAQFNLKEGENVEDHYQDQDYYEEISERMEAMAFLKLSKEEREQAMKDDDEEVEYSYEYEEKDSLAQKIAQKLKDAANTLHRTITTDSGVHIEDGIIEQMTITLAQKKALFQDLNLNPLTVPSNVITMDFIKLNSEFMTFERFMDAKIGLMQLFFTVGVQEWSDLIEMGFQSHHLFMPETD